MRLVFEAFIAAHVVH